MYTIRLQPRSSFRHLSMWYIDIASTSGQKYTAEISGGYAKSCKIIGGDSVIEIFESNNNYDGYESWDYEANKNGTLMLSCKVNKIIKIGQDIYRLPTFCQPRIVELGLYFRRFDILMSYPCVIRCIDINNIDMAATIGVVYMLKSSGGSGDA